MQHLITISKDIQSGTPVFFNTRVPIKNLFDYLKGGDSMDVFLKDFPSVNKNQALKVLEFAENVVTLKGIDHD